MMEKCIIKKNIELTRVWDSSFLDRLRLESESLTKDSKSESESVEKFGTQTQV